MDTRAKWRQGKVRARGKRRVPGQMNGTEQRYADEVLDVRLRHSQILDWAFEPDHLRLADRTFYVPDFRVMLPDGSIEFHEVKGTKRKKKDGVATGETAPYSRDKGLIKIKVAAETHPYVFRIVWRSKDGWNSQEV